MEFYETREDTHRIGELEHANEISEQKRLLSMVSPRPLQRLWFVLNCITDDLLYHSTAQQLRWQTETPVVSGR